MAGADAEAMMDAAATALEQLRRIRETPGAAANPAAEPLIGAMAELITACQLGADVFEPMRRMRAAAESLPRGDRVRTVVEEMAAIVDLVPGGPGLLEPGVVGAIADRAGVSATDRALYEAAAGIAASGEETDPIRVASAVDRMREAVRVLPADHPQRVFQLTGLALGLFRLSEVTNDITGLSEAETLLVNARHAARGPQHPQWSMINSMLADIRYRMGTRPDSHLAAVDGMRTHLWQVLLQPDLASASIAARDAARDAVDVARSCLIAHKPADAVQALDSGRGLALYAATEAGNVGSRLVAAGRDDLAARWRTAVRSGGAAALPVGLRREVLGALSESSVAAALLDPPSVAEIAAAVAAVDADALVYLIPGEGAVPGYAVAVSASGQLSYLALPNLRMDDTGDIEAYLSGAPDRDLGPAQPSEPLARSLDGLCDWAWRAAIGPLTQRYLGRLPENSGRLPRVVLVPMGDLARIPWHAARRGDGTYAIQLIAISQAVSARMLCRSAALAPVRPGPVALVVGDPETGNPDWDLPAARTEAYGIFRSFYRGARYLGRRPDGTTSPSGRGTADEVRDWLTATGPAAGAVLHLACHGMIQTDRGNATSYLVLADVGQLTAEELVTVMGRTPERAIGLVALAACSTGQAINGYDEAYSLGTAFLAAGVRSVLSTQWRIPDANTSVLMYMFHRYLMVDGLPAWDALRRAQLWMLDPHRDIPPGMPPALRRQIRRTDLTALVGWAAFVHWGQ